MMLQNRAQLFVCIHCMISLVLSLTAHLSHSGERIISSNNLTDENNHDNPFHELSGFWSFNDTFDISKYEDFDHAKFLENSGIKLEDILKTTEAPKRVITRKPPTTKPPTTTPPTNLPEFDIDHMVTNVSAQLGGTAFLHCRVRNVNERTVSWVRTRDFHILSSGVLTYTNDERFQVLHLDNTNDWDLQIKFVQKRDNGSYECQVSTGSGSISHYFNLHVVTPSAIIQGSGEYHIGEGSTISLVCTIENSPTPPQYVFWYHNDRMINYDTERGGVTVSTEPGPSTHSRLIVNQAKLTDSGNYTCRAPNTEQDTIYVFVSKEGENTAAIQRPETSSTSQHFMFPPGLLLLALACVQL